MPSRDSQRWLLMLAYYDNVDCMRFRKKPIEVEAIQWTGNNLDELKTWGAPATILPATSGESLIIGTLEDGPNSEAVHVASLNDWIIRGVAGEFYPCKPYVFQTTYDPVLD